MAHPRKADVEANPIEVRLLGAVAIVQHTQMVPYLLEQAGRLSVVDDGLHAAHLEHAGFSYTIHSSTATRKAQALRRLFLQPGKHPVVFWNIFKKAKRGFMRLVFQSAKYAAKQRHSVPGESLECGNQACVTKGNFWNTWRLWWLCAADNALNCS